MDQVKLRSRIMSVFLILAMIFTLAVTDAQAMGNDGTVKLTGVTSPSTINKGSPFSLRGKIKATEKIDKISIGIVDKETGRWVIRYFKKNVNKKTFKIKKADSYIRFGQLKMGTYYYRINLKFKGKETMRVLNNKFTVVDNRAETVSIKVPENRTLKLSGVKAPGTYPVGKLFTPKGTVTANKKITKVEVGIVFAGTGKWLEYKYTGKPFSSKTFDLSKAASKLQFDKLPGGDYYYRMYVHTADGVKIAFNKPFTVLPSNKPKKAVKWAVKIANDDEFSYGKKPKTSKVGCYFCGTTKIRKPKGYEKTYVCLTFLAAAYAHGAKDPEMLAECKEGKHTMMANEHNMKKYSCWQKIGLAKDLTVEDLQPGDVLVYYTADGVSNGHVAMYVSGNKMVDAEGIKDCWGPNSIAVRDKAAAMLVSAAKFNKKSYVMRYRY